MLNKTRSDSRLGKLPPDQQAEIYRRLKTETYAAVQHWLAQPPPNGLNLKTHINSLYRFFHRYDVNLAFAQSMTAALSPARPEVQHQIRFAAVQETGRLIAINSNARAAYTLFSKQFYKSDLAEFSRAKRTLAREERRRKKQKRESPGSRPVSNDAHRHR